jgi:diguanylate cyclase (GGDEF)-like protein
VGGLLRRELREVDLAARWGGEELCVLLPDTEAQTAEEVAERLRAAVEASRIRATDGSPLQVTASFGVAPSLPDDGDLLRLVDAADQAMYQAKRGGRNQVRVWSASKPEVGVG